jgi:hypothetical protein
MLPVPPLRADAGKIRSDADVPGEVEQVRRKTVVLRDCDQFQGHCQGK